MIIKLPIQSCLYTINDQHESYKQSNAITKELFKIILKGTNRLAILLIDEYNNVNSKFKDYINILPDIDSMLTPIHWNNDLLHHFPYIHIVSDVSLQSKNWLSLYNLIMKIYQQTNLEFVSYQVTIIHNIQDLSKYVYIYYLCNN